MDYLDLRISSTVSRLTDFSSTMAIYRLKSTVINDSVCFRILIEQFSFKQQNRQLNKATTVKQYEFQSNKLSHWLNPLLNYFSPELQPRTG